MVERIGACQAKGPTQVAHIDFEKVGPDCFLPGDQLTLLLETDSSALCSAYLSR